MVNSTLTPNQEAFCRFVVKGDNRCDAFVKAGYSGRGAESNSAHLIKKPHIARRIAELKELVARGEKFSVPEKRVEAPYTSPYDPNSAPNFSDPDIAWLRKECFENMTAARSEGNFSAANAAWELLYKTMFTPDVAKVPGGRPRVANPNNSKKGDEDPNHDKPERAINVSIFNQVAERVDRAGRDEPPGQVITVEATPVTPQRNLPDLRPESAAFSFDGSAGDLRERVPLETGGSGTE
jgi:hypothetical protein